MTTDLRTLEWVPRSLTKRYEPVFTRLAVVKVSLRLATYQHVRPPSWPHLFTPVCTRVALEVPLVGTLSPLPDAIKFLDPAQTPRGTPRRRSLSAFAEIKGRQNTRGNTRSSYGLDITSIVCFLRRAAKMRVV